MKRAKKDLPTNIAEKLHALINLIETSKDFRDVANMQIYHLHPLQGKRKGQYALDIAGRRAGYRLLVVPLDEDGNEWEMKDTDMIYKFTKILIIQEVTNHYE